MVNLGPLAPYDGSFVIQRDEPAPQVPIRQYDRDGLPLAIDEFATNKPAYKVVPARGVVVELTADARALRDAIAMSKTVMGKWKILCNVLGLPQ